MKTRFIFTAALAMVITASAALADPGDRIERRYDRRGDAIAEYYDQKGDRINAHYEELALAAALRGDFGTALRLDAIGDRINAKMDAKGERLNRELDREGRKIDRAMDHRASLRDRWRYHH